MQPVSHCAVACAPATCKHELTSALSLLLLTMSRSIRGILLFTKGGSKRSRRHMAHGNDDDDEEHHQSDEEKYQQEAEDEAEAERMAMRAVGVHVEGAHSSGTLGAHSAGTETKQGDRGDDGAIIVFL